MKPNQLLTVFALMGSLTLQAHKQSGLPLRLFSYNISLYDYDLPKQIKDSSFNKAFQQKEWYKPATKSCGFGISH